MVLILFGPSCSGKSSVARILAQRTGAKVWTGLDYLRLAKSEPQAWQKFMDILEEASTVPKLGPESVIYILTEPVPKDRDLPSRSGTRRVRFTANLETLKERFAPRVGGRMPEAVVAMLERALKATAVAPADVEYDTSERTSEEVADELLEWCAR